MAKLILKLMSLLLILGLVLHGVVNAENLTGQLQFSRDAYRINVGDVLSLNVYNQPDLSDNSIMVRSDGNASFNGIGEVYVEGKTIHEVSQYLERQIGELIKDPKLNLTILESRSPTIYLAGAVMHPGMLSTNDIAGFNKNPPALSGSSRMDFRISNVLASAGGVTLNADLANVIITRNGQPYKTVNLWNMLKKGEMDNDVMLQTGDSVYIPKLPLQALDDETYQLLLNSNIGPKYFPIRIIGEVKIPGIYDLDGASPYLNSVIARAGGYTTDANQNVIALKRFTGKNQFSTLFINPKKLDIILRPNDIIYISELKIYHLGRFTDNANKILSPFSNGLMALFDLVLIKTYSKQ